MSRRNVLPLNKGDKVDVFVDPVNRSFLEGTAILVQDHGIAGYVNSFPVEEWDVRFLGNQKNIFRRKIFNSGKFVKKNAI